MEPGRQTCLICLKNNYESRDLQFFDMATVVWGNMTYLNKLEFVLNAEIVVYDSTSICNNCLYDLNNAYGFKEKVTRALEYWTSKFEENINIVKQVETIGSINEPGIGINIEVVEMPPTQELTEMTVIQETPRLCALEPSIEQTNVLNRTPPTQEFTEFTVIAETPRLCSLEPSIEQTNVLNRTPPTQEFTEFTVIAETPRICSLEPSIEQTNMSNRTPPTQEFAEFTVITENPRLCALEPSVEQTNVPNRIPPTQEFAEFTVIAENPRLCALEPSVEQTNLSNKTPSTQEFTEFTVIAETPRLRALEPSVEQTNVSNNDDNLQVTSQFECYKCKEVFQTASQSINHNCSTENSIRIEEDKPLEHTIPVEEDAKPSAKSDKFPCTLCKLEFNSKRKLGKHQRASHNSVNTAQRYSCTDCTRTFKQSYHLKEHMARHTGEHNFTCEVCGKNFQRLSSQRRHMRTHEAPPGEKSKKTPYLCNICGKEFPYSNGAQRHMRTHTGDRRYECEFCPKKFNQSTHLKVHMRTHTGERPYMCSICGKGYALKATLVKHVRAHRESKDDVKIMHNLEPNLSRADSSEEEADVRRDDYLIHEIS